MKCSIISTMGAAPWGGSEELWAAMARHAAADGHQVSAHLWRMRQARPQADDLAAQGVRIFQYPPPDSRFQRWKQRVIVRHPSLLRWLGRFLFSFDGLIQSRPDVVLLSLGDTYVLGMHREYQWLLSELRSHQIPYVVVVQLSVDHWHPEASAAQVTRQALTHAHRVGFVSEHNLRLVERQLNVTLHNGLVLRNPVNLLDQSLVPWCVSDRPTFAMPARLQFEHKGHDLILGVLARPQWKAREWMLRLYGSGPDESAIRTAIAKHGMQDKVELCGHVFDVRSIWAENQMLLMPSRMEGTPLSMVEAMLCGRPGVYSSAGGIPEWIRDERDGFLAAEASEDQLADAMERAWARRDQWQAMGLSARARALELVDPNPGATLLKLLEDAAKSKA